MQSKMINHTPDLHRLAQAYAAAETSRARRMGLGIRVVVRIKGDKDDTRNGSKEGA